MTVFHNQLSSGSPFESQFSYGKHKITPVPVWQLNLFHQFSYGKLSLKSNYRMAVHIQSPISSATKNKTLQKSNIMLAFPHASHTTYIHNFLTEIGSSYQKKYLAETRSFYPNMHQCMHDFPAETVSFKNTMPMHSIPAETGSFIKNKNLYTCPYTYMHISLAKMGSFIIIQNCVNHSHSYMHDTPAETGNFIKMNKN